MMVTSRRTLTAVVALLSLTVLIGCKQKYVGANGIKASLNLYPTAGEDLGVRAGLGYYYHWDGEKDRWEAGLEFVPDWGNLSNYYITLKGNYVYLLKMLKQNIGLYATGGAGIFYESETPVHESSIYPMVEGGIGAIVILGSEKKAIPLDFRLCVQAPFGAENADLIIATSLGYEF